MQMFILAIQRTTCSNGIMLVICDIMQLVNPSNAENKTLITGVTATILMVLFI